MAADGRIEMQTALDTSGAIKDAKKLDVALAKASVEVDKQNAKVKDLEKQYENLANGIAKTAEQKGLEKNLADAEKEVSKLTAQADKLESALKDAQESYQMERGKGALGNPEKEIQSYIEINKELAQVYANLDIAKINADKVQKALDEVKVNPTATAEAEKLKAELNKAKISAEEAKIKLDELNSSKSASSGAAVSDAGLASIKPSAFNKLRSAASRALDKIKSGFSSVSKSGSASTKVVAGFGKRLTSIVKSALIFTVLYKAFGTLRDYIGGVISTNNTFMASLGQVKSNLMTAFQPIWEAITPALNALGSALSTVTAYIASFVSMLFGKSVSASQASAASLNKQAKALDGVAESAENASGSLAGFDDLDVLDSGDSASSSGGSSTSAASPGFNTDFSTVDTSVFQPFLDFINSIDFNPLITSANAFFAALSSIAGIGWGMLMDVWDTVFKPLSTWTIETLLPEILNTLSQAFLALGAVITPVWDGLMMLWQTALAPIAEFIGGTIIWAIQLLGQVFAQIGETFTEHGDAIVNIFKNIGSVLSTVWNGILKAIFDAISENFGWIFEWVINVLLGDVLGGVIEALSVITDGVRVFVDWLVSTFGWLVDWIVNAFSGVGQFLQSLFSVGGNIVSAVTNGLGDIFKNAINFIFSGINSIIRMPLDFLNGILNFIKEINILGFQPFWGLWDYNPVPVPQIPYLATGAVIEGGRPFLAMLGDQPAGQTNIETPLSTMIEAFETALSNYNSGTINLQINGQTFARLLNPFIGAESQRVGVQLVKSVR